MADEKLTAATRIEKLLDNIAGGDNDVTPATRLEKFLSYIADAMEGGGGSGGGGCECDLPIRKLSVSADDYYESGHVYAYLDGEWKMINEGVLIYNVSGLESGNALLVYEQLGMNHLVTTWEAPFSYAGADGVQIGENLGYYLVGSGVIFIDHSTNDIVYTTLTSDQISIVDSDEPPLG